ncbi:glucose/quinate/shikimate family membrane-bound PQQ-dependent dehydrogenase [Pantoea sp. Bo_2]|uniref:Glucose/quinate/shikimate family membrane-bound PQQ-dependent dehydrogenase n=1 Tax=Candidatus Pantoea gossypiicola TaxID=2608008 RepID=A0AB34CS86_9GAMM|nr:MULTISPECIES: glucose/quinate/shikimate family membrane-bound PQQ-dependent dehydrogenase [Pantoea]KAA5923934.1 glucose/quinate/shikimate family membrane-bound PQQ-dependent dehydrogenase [Pantoea sp. VH_8]KAA5930181.1 glucose/quinate/shikimate family membrane-bound PQQ-dependent dehydrogenase [Pantoea sp. VH_4]KAA5946632.1 glucose/quinate/shikimate family membrane-bound PQQ-dependent dehydrogenase [Pantoea sp. VH_3]KAA5956871.1 glucose/quinate/shikimate family membrane-bound PQQ-dependent d
MAETSSRSGKGLGIASVLLGLVLLATGLFFAIGGGKLVALGGSGYFLIAGIVTVLSAIQFFRRKSSAVILFLMVFVGTLIWSLFDAGLEFWPLVSRLMLPAGLMLLAFLIWPSLRKHEGKHSLAKPSYAFSALLAAGMVITLVQMFQPHPTVAGTGEELPLVPVDKARQQKDWDNYGNTPQGSRFVALDQITRDNVKDLKVAWTFHTGDTPVSPTGNGAEDQQTPLQIGNTLYLCTPHNNVIAVEANSGKQIWKREINAKAEVWPRCRGLAYFDATKPLQQPDKPGSSPVPAAVLPAGDTCQRRILMNTIDARLIAINADNGEFCENFGDHGIVDLKAGLGQAPDPQYQLTSAPTLAGTTVVVGGRVADNVQTDMPGGVLRGFDVITGKMRWAFDPGNVDPNAILMPGKDYTRSTPNSWAPMSYDPAMNTVFIPMGSSSVDLWGANRTELDHKYGASVLALDATTGKEKWVYQTVHNDLWDFDLPMQPSLIDFPQKDGSTTPAVVIGGKTGMIFVLDRMTGKPLTKVEELPMPQGHIPNEQYTKTQPHSTGMPQIGNQTLKESDMWGATPFDQLACRIAFKSMRYDGLFTVPDTDKSLSFPGSLGGMNWGSMSIDPNNHLLFVNDMRLGLWVQMIPADTNNIARGSNGGEAINTGMGAVPLKGTPYAVNKNRFMSPLGIPCQKPPFGTLSAIDLKTQKIVWQVPVGTVQDTGPFGIKMRVKMPVGMPTLGGTLATQGGLVFIAGTQDYYLRAFDSSTGKEVWKARLPVGSQGGPMSYVSPKDGKQYILISAGGARQSPDRGDYVIAYALPDSK